MAIIDISVPLSPNVITWNDRETALKLKWLNRIGENNSTSNGSEINLGSHTGTHLDAPLHFIPDGKTVDQLDLNHLIGLCQVIDFSHVVTRNISKSDLENAPISNDTTRIIFKTGNTVKGLLHKSSFTQKFVAVDPEAAKWIVDRGIKTVGVDYLSVGSAHDGTGAETHRILLGAEIIILEALALDNVEPGIYTLIALPLKSVGAEGSPMRAVLIEP